MPYTQANRQFSVSTPLGEDVLLLVRFNGEEGISRPFSFDLEMASENDSISFDAMVGKKVTVRATVADEGERYWNGFVTRFAQTGRDEDLTIYHATVVPWLWFLMESTNCKIFQNMTVPDIIYKVFGDLGFTDYEPRGLGSYPTREYCVQYRESAFNFVMPPRMTDPAPGGKRELR